MSDKDSEKQTQSPNADEPNGFIDSDRESLLKDYYEQNPDGLEDSSDGQDVKDDQVDNQDDGQVDNQVDDDPSDKEPTEDNTDKNDVGDTSNDAPEKDATDDKDGKQTIIDNLNKALKEERSKRQSMSDKVDQLLDDNRKLMELVQKPSSSEDTDDQGTDDMDDEFVDPVVKQLKQEVAELKTVLTKEQESKRQETAAKQQADFNSTLDIVDAELAKEGFQGFKQFQPLVLRHLLETSTVDKQGMRVNPLDNPEGWKQIYKEHVFPGMKGVFTTMDKKDKTDKKVDAKKKANLSGKHGGVDSPQEKDIENKSQAEMWSDYMERRKKSVLD